MKSVWLNKVDKKIVDLIS